MSYIQICYHELQLILTKPLLVPHLVDQTDVLIKTTSAALCGRYESLIAVELRRANC